jgi:hypothetical protein
MRALPVLLATLLAFAASAKAGEPTVDERLARLAADQASLQGRADGEGRLGLLAPIGAAGLLADALAIRLPTDAGHTLDALPAPRRQAYAALADLDDALREAMNRPGEGARALARTAGERAIKVLDALATTDDLPLVLQVSPRVVPPRRDNALLVVPPETIEPPPADAKLDVQFAELPKPAPVVPVTPVYAPAFMTAVESEPPVEVEIAGLHLASDAEPPTLAVGDWRGEAVVSPERLRFTVPRQAFGVSETRSALATATLALRHDGRVVTIALPFLVLPDRPGSVALDQQVRWMVPESNTLMSPEIMVRAGAGETRSVRRCFDPPAGWHFDKAHRRVVIVERLGWLEDQSDPTLNGGTVEFASDEGDQVCLLVEAKAVTKGARTATIGRFEATLVHEEAQERADKSGVRALDWHEPLRLPVVADAAARRLYVHLFDEIDRTFEDLPDSLPFVRVTHDGDTLVLQADPSAAP